MSLSAPTPRLAALDDGSGLPMEEPEVEQVPITDQDVQEYREQDRFLPVEFSILQIRTLSQ
jgi:hypothetical protein